MVLVPNPHSLSVSCLISHAHWLMWWWVSHPCINCFLPRNSFFLARLQIGSAFHLTTHYTLVWSLRAFPLPSPIKSLSPFSLHEFCNQILLLLNLLMNSVYCLDCTNNFTCIFLGFFTTISQEKVQRWAPARALYPPVPHPCVFRRE